MFTTINSLILDTDNNELTDLADSHMAQQFWNKENVDRFDRFKPRLKDEQL